MFPLLKLIGTVILELKKTILMVDSKKSPEEVLLGIFYRIKISLYLLN